VDQPKDNSGDRPASTTAGVLLLGVNMSGRDNAIAGFPDADGRLAATSAGSDPREAP
jgi:hypothetical protein